MSSRISKNIIQFGIAAVLVFAPLAKGVVNLWSITLVEIVIFLLLFLWLWRVNNRGEIVSPDPEASGRGRNDRKFKKTKLDLPIALFAILAGVSCVFSIYKHASMLEMFRMAAVVGVFYLVVNNFGHKGVLRLAVLVVIMGMGMSLLGLGQYFLGLDHSWWIPRDFLASTYVNHNHFAGYLELAIPLALGMFIGLKKEKLFRTGLIAALSLMVIALIFSHSRGAWICLTVSLLVMNLVLIKRGILKKGSLVIFLLIIILGITYLCAGYDTVAQRLRTAQQLNEEDFVKTRKEIWQGSINIIKENPLIGTGIGTFVWGLPAHRPQGLAGARAHYAHNDYLHMLVELGVLALPLMLWIIFLALRNGFRGQGVERAGFGLTDGIVLGSAVGILSLALHGLVDFNFHITANMLTCALLTGFIVSEFRYNMKGRSYA